MSLPGSRPGSGCAVWQGVAVRKPKYERHELGDRGSSVGDPSAVMASLVQRELGRLFARAARLLLLVVNELCPVLEPVTLLLGELEDGT